MSGFGKIRLIAGVSQNGVIGLDNQLPWKISEDLKRFRQLTTGGVVVMGRKTFDSIGRPLPNRENWVLTRSADFKSEGVRVFRDWLDLKSAMKESGKMVWVIGGEEIYRLALPDADELYLTWVDQSIEGDAFFPEWEAIQKGQPVGIQQIRFLEKKREAVQRTDLSFNFVDYIRQNL